MRRLLPVGLLPVLFVQGALGSTGRVDAVYARLLARLDLDHDGTLSPAEYARVDDAANFGSLDLDDDGHIDVAELRTYVELTPPRPRTSEAPPSLPGPVPAATVPAHTQAPASRLGWYAAAALAGGAAFGIGALFGRRRR